jgi:predicted nucleotidyltransferase
LSLEKIKEPHRTIIEKMLELLSIMSEKLVSVVIFGSVARGSAREDSDIDLLMVAESLPESRMERQKLFLQIEEPLQPLLDELLEKGFHIDFSPIILSVEEASKIRPMYLDMIEDSIILYDKDDFFKRVLARLRRRLEEAVKMIETGHPTLIDAMEEGIVLMEDEEYLDKVLRRYRELKAAGKLVRTSTSIIF